MATPTNLIFQDEFTEASNAKLDAHTPTTLGTGWTGLNWDANNYLQVVASSDVVELVRNAAGNRGAVINDTPNDDDQAAEAIISNNGGNNGPAGIGVRVSLSGANVQAYFVEVGITNGIRIGRKKAGTTTYLGSWTTDTSSGQTLRISAVSDGSGGTDVTLERYSGGSWSTIIGPVNDTAANHLTGGGPGIYVLSASNGIDLCDDFKAYDTGGAVVAAFVAHRSFLGFPP